MKFSSYLFTSESVSEGHPDKIADQIGDLILDALMEKDPYSRLACEVMILSNMVIIGGEVSSRALETISMVEKVRSKIKEIGYDQPEKGFDYKNAPILTALNTQSEDIARGVFGKNKTNGFGSTRDSHLTNLKAGDQGLMFGYAIDETKEFMPLSICLAHQLVSELARFRKEKGKTFLWPDSKSQVTVEYENDKIKSLKSIVISTQHSPEISQKDLLSFIRDEFLKSLKNPLKQWLSESTKIIVNPTGRFVIGGPRGDCGLLGRKIIVDTYGGHGAHGGGAFSGKDPSKVDRSGAYIARHIAKNVVASGLAKRFLVQIAYVIGMSKPVSLMINDFETSEVSLQVLSKAIKKIWNLEPKNIIEFLDLLKPRYSKTATYGHFGRNEEEFTWEKLDKVEVLKETVRSLTQTSIKESIRS